MRPWSLTAACVILSAQLPSAIGYKILSDDTIQHRLPKPQTSDFDIHNGNLLAPILIPRVPGTENSTRVLNHFQDYFHTSLPAWTITTQNSTSKTPVHGDQAVPFRNFIATRLPPWASPGDAGYLTLVAHYDSKAHPAGFVGATDSAAPCAMILHAVTAIDHALTKKWNKMQADGYDPDFSDDHVRGIQVLFLDGEEAFLQWTDTDSIYGARSLAEEWDNTMYPAMSTYKTPLNAIELFVLLDLLGSGEDLSIPSWMMNTHWAYQHLAALEQRFRKLGLFKSSSRQTWLPDKDKHNDATFRQSVMQDDHIPFVARGVPALHLIPSIFPSQWHRTGDNAEYLDINTVEDWALLTSAFAAEYLELEGYFDDSFGARVRDEL